MDKLLHLKPDKSAGPDGIHPLLMKECASEISLPLQLIYLKSFETGSVPRDWRLANITPVFKKGKRNELGNYRPVSLTSVPGKVMESLVKDRMTEYYAEKCSLSSNQHGFTSGLIYWKHLRPGPITRRIWIRRHLFGLLQTICHTDGYLKNYG